VLAIKERVTLQSKKKPGGGRCRGEGKAPIFLTRKGEKREEKGRLGEEKKKTPLYRDPPFPEKGGGGCGGGHVNAPDCFARGLR